MYIRSQRKAAIIIDIDQHGGWGYRGVRPLA